MSSPKLSKSVMDWILSSLQACKYTVGFAVQVGVISEFMEISRYSCTGPKLGYD
jgi:hypothetical protein